jgi:hypothetical protein
MILKIHSDASHLSESNARGRAGGHFCFDNADPTNTISDQAPVDVISTIMPTVHASAAESEYGALFVNGQHGEALRTTADELGHVQPATPITCDNEVAVGISNDRVKIKRAKAIDMRYHWVRDRVRQNHFTIVWGPGKFNKADFFTKIHPVSHHRETRLHYVRDAPLKPTDPP